MNLTSDIDGTVGRIGADLELMLQGRMDPVSVGRIAHIVAPIFGANERQSLEDLEEGLMQAQNLSRVIQVIRQHSTSYKRQRNHLSDREWIRLYSSYRYWLRSWSVYTREVVCASGQVIYH